jgi:hypothetical protein
LVDNLTIKFSSKSALEKIIEYINFETSNKYTVIFNQFPNNNSRPNTRGTNLSIVSKPGSPVARKLSGTKAYNISSLKTKKIKSENNSEKLTSEIADHINYLNDGYEDYEDFDSNLVSSDKDNEEVDEHILSKVLKLLFKFKRLIYFNLLF